MFSKLAVLLLSAAAIVSAQVSSTTTEAKCNVGKLQCCSDVQKPDSQAVQQQLGVFNLAAGAIHGLVGIKCNPISALIGAGTGSNCNANPVCCTGNHFNGVIAIGCTPINVNV